MLDVNDTVGCDAHAQQHGWHAGELLMTGAAAAINAQGGTSRERTVLRISAPGAMPMCQSPGPRTVQCNRRKRRKEGGGSIEGVRAPTSQGAASHKMHWLAKSVLIACVARQIAPCHPRSCSSSLATTCAVRC